MSSGQTNVLVAIPAAAVFVGVALVPLQMATAKHEAFFFLTRNLEHALYVGAAWFVVFCFIVRRAVAWFRLGELGAKLVAVNEPAREVMKKVRDA